MSQQRKPLTFDGPVGLSPSHPHRCAPHEAESSTVRLAKRRGPSSKRRGRWSQTADIEGFVSTDYNGTEEAAQCEDGYWDHVLQSEQSCFIRPMMLLAFADADASLVGFDVDCRRSARAPTTEDTSRCGWNKGVLLLVCPAKCRSTGAGEE